LVSGDDQTVEEARRYAPEAVRFISKHSLGWRSQVSLPPKQVRRLLAEAARDALARPLPKPFVLEPPYRLDLDMTSQVAAELLAYLPGVARNNAFGITAEFTRLDAVMRFVAFAILYSPTGALAL